MIKSEFIKHYTDTHDTTSVVLYRKSKNIFVNMYNYIFNNYGVLKVVKHDNFWIFNIYKYDVCALSFIFSPSFTGVDIMYRNVRIDGDYLIKTDMRGFRTARKVNDKRLLCEHLVHLLDGTF